MKCRINNIRVNFHDYCNKHWLQYHIKNNSLNRKYCHNCIWSEDNELFG